MAAYLGAKRVKGKDDPSANGKTIVAGIFNRKGRVQIEIILNARRKRPQDIIQGPVKMETIIHSDGWRGQNRLDDLGYKKQFRTDHGKKELLEGEPILTVLRSFEQHQNQTL